MLIYHPVFDIYHCIFRILRLLNRMPKEAHTTERIRILDFYLLFPEQLNSFSFPRGFSTLKKCLLALPPRYETFPDPRLIFNQMEAYQKAALEKLSASGLIDAAQLSNGNVLLLPSKLPADLKEALQHADQKFPELIAGLSEELSAVDLYGKSGLKHRSDLFEYRYDPKPN